MGPWQVEGTASSRKQLELRPVSGAPLSTIGSGAGREFISRLRRRVGVQFCQCSADRPRRQEIVARIGDLSEEGDSYRRMSS